MVPSGEVDDDKGIGLAVVNNCPRGQSARAVVGTNNYARRPKIEVRKALQSDDRMESRQMPMLPEYFPFVFAELLIEHAPRNNGPAVEHFSQHNGVRYRCHDNHDAASPGNAVPGRRRQTVQIARCELAGHVRNPPIACRLVFNRLLNLVGIGAWCDGSGDRCSKEAKPDLTSGDRCGEQRQPSEAESGVEPVLLEFREMPAGGQESVHSGSFRSLEHHPHLIV